MGSPYFDLDDISFHDAPTLAAMPCHRRAIKKAHEHGNIDPQIAAVLGLEYGQHACKTCGMRAWTKEDALACCGDMIEGPCGDKRTYDRTQLSPRTGLKILDGPALVAAIKEKTGSKTNTEAEEKLGLHDGHLSKMTRRIRLGMTEENYDKLRRLFGGEVPFMGVK